MSLGSKAKSKTKNTSGTTKTSAPSAPLTVQSQPNVPATLFKAMGLILDVKTRWNSCFAMLKRFYDLMFAVVMFINRIVQSGDKSVEKFKLQNLNGKTLNKSLNF